MRVRGASYEVALLGLGPIHRVRHSVGGGWRERNASSFPLGLTRPCRPSNSHGKPPFSCPPLPWVLRGGRGLEVGSWFVFLGVGGGVGRVGGVWVMGVGGFFLSRSWLIHPLLSPFSSLPPLGRLWLAPRLLLASLNPSEGERCVRQDEKQDDPFPN